MGTVSYLANYQMKEAPVVSRTAGSHILNTGFMLTVQTLGTCITLVLVVTCINTNRPLGFYYISNNSTGSNRPLGLSYISTGSNRPLGLVLHRMW